MVVFRKKSPHRLNGEKDEVLVPECAVHGIIGWVEEDGARVPYVFHNPTKEFVPMAKFIQFRAERAEHNRQAYVHKPKSRRDRLLRPYMVVMDP
ncbi:MAG: hypothetical protein WA051_02655 [Minisyncoccia bacterium]